jgi:putative transposase
MGRGRRICFPGAFFHCINRGNRRGKISYDQLDHQQMLKCLGDACERYDVLIQGCCLIPNHFHFLIQQNGLPVSSAMRSLETQYAIYFSKRHHKVGPLFQSRFRGILGEQQANLLDLLRYTPLNPVRAKLVKQPQEWAWRRLPVNLGLSLQLTLKSFAITRMPFAKRGGQWFILKAITAPLEKSSRMAKKSGFICVAGMGENASN